MGGESESQPGKRSRKSGAVCVGAIFLATPRPTLHPILLQDRLRGAVYPRTWLRRVSKSNSHGSAGFKVLSRNSTAHTSLGVTMNERLWHAVQTVARERGGKFKAAFAAVASLVAEFGESDIADRIVSEIPASVAWEVVADLLGILEWSTRDNGASIHRAAERWLIDGNDVRRIQVALHLDAYPFQDFEQMTHVLGRLRWQCRR